jgi:asparagine synthase (glutamine-hydrolysing)
MAMTVRHRGPDGQGFHVGPGVGLGIRRLAIIDLETGDQPIYNEDESVAVMCNGEIYNHVELRACLEARGHRFRTRSDVEVIVHLYEEHGLDAVQRLRGMFGFALWDAVRRRLWLVRDRLGIKPLHYVLTPGGIYFASEQKAILAAGVDPGPPEVRALDSIFTYGFVPDPHTMFRGIHRLAPGHWLTFQEGTVETRQYWSLPVGRAAPRGGEVDAARWAERLRAKLEETVRVHLRSDVPIGAWLSSGVDSSALVAMACRMGHRVPAFTLGFEESSFDEARDRRTLDQVPGYSVPNERVSCERSAFERYPEALWHAETPSAGSAEIPRLLLSEAAARRVKVVLTGEGADEVLGGYRWHAADRILSPAALLPRAIRGYVSHRLLGPWGRQIASGPREMSLPRFGRMAGPEGAADRHTLFTADLREALRVAGPPPGDGMPEPRPRDRFERLQQHDLGQRLPAYNTLTVDSASMAYGLEARLPFLDHELVELCAEIPPRLKVRRFWRKRMPQGWYVGKYVLRRAVADLLPSEMVWQRKIGLQAPLASWLRGRLPAFAEEALSPERLRAAGYFEPGTVASLLERHRARPGSDGRLLVGVLGVQLWDELFRRAGGRARTAT